MLTYNRKITISSGANRFAKQWLSQELMLSELWEKLKIPVRSTETLAEYYKLPKAQQDNLKDVGGFVGGALNGVHRKSGAVAGRDIVTLDLDNIPAGRKDDILRRVDSLGCGYCVYSTRKHQPAAPRLRVLLPLDRTVTADEYEPIARKAAEYIGLEFADKTTFEPSRLMYYPSCCSDGEYVYLTGDKPFLSANGILAQYADWHDVSLWPALPGQQSFRKIAVRQGDPESKNGVVGAFCRQYDIRRAMDELIPGIYEPVDQSPDRFTYIGGSTTGGAVLYDNGKFLYSHHATDPCSGRLVNAFDMVRLHRFGDQDDDAEPGTPVNRLRSYKLMSEFAGSISSVAAEVTKERYESAAKDFDGLEQADSTDWVKLLEINSQTGAVKPTIDNILIIFEHDPALKGKFALNKFAGRGMVLDTVPWDQSGERRFWEDNDISGLYWYLQKVYGIKGREDINSALSLHSHKHSFNEVQSYLKGLQEQWDGVPRLDTLFVDYFGAEDSPYTRAVTRKAFVAAVARAMRPGCKFDNMLILAGKQGLGKSTFFDKMSRGWFNDSIRSFEGKDASELLQGVWIVEIAELDAFRKTDISRIKQFLSLRVDRFRAAYGKNVQDLPRTCVFFGTTNATEYLQDRTGNRRFWPVDTGVQECTKSVFTDLDNEVDQIWAEAYFRWQIGEPLYLTDEIKKAAEEMQERHREVSGREGVIKEFLEREVPEDWNRWPLDKRRMFWNGMDSICKDVKLVPRDRVCVAEVWCEALGGSLKDLSYFSAREIDSIIESLPDWEKGKNSIRFGRVYGQLRGYVRKV